MSLDVQHLNRCIQTLESSLTMLDASVPASVEYEVFRNAAIKGFELTLETAGKLLRKALKPYFGAAREVDQLTYKDIFRHAAKHGLLSIEETERWFAYRDNRNNKAHDYGEVFARETLALLPGFLADAKALMKRIERVET
jgi:nucleotidyltransferase substrate binding protein (TIGR01987 family)